MHGKTGWAMKKGKEGKRERKEGVVCHVRAACGHVKAAEWVQQNVRVAGVLQNATQCGDEVGRLGRPRVVGAQRQALAGLMER